MSTQNEAVKQNNDAKKKKYAILKGKGLNQKQIAKELQVTEKTIGSWAKSLPIGSNLIIRNQLQKRLIVLSKDNNTKITDLCKLTKSLYEIDKMINRDTNCT
jgi:transposase